MLSLALKWLLRPDVEGGEVNHPADRGGHTKYGIADAADGKKDGMADLDRDGVPDIAIGDLTPALSIAVFDAAVHHGPKRAIQQLQQVLGVMADGRLGPGRLAGSSSNWAPRASP
ncbi:MAG: glycosyl hydrolase 108 family protein [Aeromonas sp.]